LTLFFDTVVTLFLIGAFLLGYVTSNIPLVTNLALGFVYTIYGVCYLAFKEQLDQLERVKHI